MDIDIDIYIDIIVMDLIILISILPSSNFYPLSLCSSILQLCCLWSNMPETIQKSTLEGLGFGAHPDIIFWEFQHWWFYLIFKQKVLPPESTLSLCWTHQPNFQLWAAQMLKVSPTMSTWMDVIFIMISIVWNSIGLARQQLDLSQGTACNFKEWCGCGCRLITPSLIIQTAFGDTVLQERKIFLLLFSLLLANLKNLTDKWRWPCINDLPFWTMC